jgi:uncharacterized protein YjbI with pentapeptide repeats
MSTRSYKIKDLRNCFITASYGGRSTRKPAYDFRGANLIGANLRHGDFSACDFTDATIDRITIGGCRMTLRQLASTKNFKKRDLSGMRLEIRFDDEDADLSGMDLSDSELLLGKRRVRIQDAVIRKCKLGFVFTKEDFYSTKDYQRGELYGMSFSGINMSGWDFSKKNLTGSAFGGCNLAGAKFDDALLSQARIVEHKEGDSNFTLDQFKSTWNYKSRLMYGLEVPKPIADAVKAEMKDSAPQGPATRPSADNRSEKLSLRHLAKSERPRKRYLRDKEEIDTLLAGSSDLSDVASVDLGRVGVPSVVDDVLKQIGLRCKNIDSLRLGGSTSVVDGETAPELSDQGLEYISRMQSLRQLSIACRCSAKGFSHLVKLPELKMLGLHHLTLTSREVFPIVAKMPKIRTVVFRYCDLSQPIDPATHKAIASLNGRLELLSFGEWAETKIHLSMIPAIAEIKSLTWLELGDFVATYKDLDPLRKGLLNLRHIGPCGDETEDIVKKKP